MTFVPPPQPPESEVELAARARRLAGRSLGDLARERRIQVPLDPRRAKGWIGLLLEQALGATAASRALPDFPQLGIEMKSLPVDERGQPRESTYVCTAPLDGSMPRRWEESWPCHKLARVLWVPIITPPRSEIGERLVGTPFFWSPEPDQEETLRSDYQQLTERIDRGEVWDLDARHGVALQLRPKGAHGEDWVWALDEQGEWVQTSPRGFYLRASFTHAVVRRALLLPG